MSTMETFEDYNTHILDNGRLILFPKEYATYEAFQNACNVSYPLLIKDLLDLCNEYLESASTLSEIERMNLENEIENKWREIGYRAPKDIFEKIPRIVFVAVRGIHNRKMLVQNVIESLEFRDVKEPVQN
jgi:hypothetical protein